LGRWGTAPCGTEPTDLFQGTRAGRYRGSGPARYGTASIIAVAPEQSEQEAFKLDLDALVREGARRMLLVALKAEVDQYVAEHAEHRDAAGHALVVRNGVAEPRKVTTAAGELEIQAPRVHDRREGRRFTSAILPPWARRSPKVTEVLPVLYLRGISTKDFEPALAEFFGSEAGGKPRYGQK